MNFLMKNLMDVVYLTNPELDRDNLGRRLLDSDILISDLDGTIAHSPAKAIVLDYFKDKKNLVDSRFLAWIFLSLYKF